jgi:hypothetical protein
MGFPYIARYFLRFRHSDSGLQPGWSYFKYADTTLDVETNDVDTGRTPRPHPAIIELGGGTYYFDWEHQSADAPDIVFEVDGTTSIPTEEVRYISDTISPRDHYLDEPISQVVRDVWSDERDYSEGYAGTTKGAYLTFMGRPVDEYYQDTVFGKIQHIGLVDIMGAIDNDNSLSGGKSVQEVFNAVGTVTDVVVDAMGGLVPPDNAGIAAIKAKTDLLPNDMGTFLTTITSQMVRVLGMLHENSVLDKIRYDGTTNNLKTARLRTYANSDAAAAAKQAGDNLDYETDMVGQYSIVCEYSGDNMTSYLVVKEFPLT